MTKMLESRHGWARGATAATRVRGLAPLARSCAFALVFWAAVVLGRMTVMDGTSLSMVWPAAGVAAVWFLAQRDARTSWFDWGALALITFTVNHATGAPPVLAGCFVAANVLQVAVFKATFSRWCPLLWGGGGTAPLNQVRQLWRLLGAAAAATAAGSLFGPTAAGLVTGHWSLVVFVVWMTRNTASIMLIGLVGLRVGAALHRRRAGGPAEAGPPASRGELAAVVAASAVAYTLTFGMAHGLPLAFLLIVITVWVGTRFGITFAAVHDLLVGTVAVLLTLQGLGPFAEVGSDPIRALVVQAFILVTAVTGLSLALLRDERDALVRTVAQQAREAADQARMLTTVMESMHEGVLVVDPTGAVVLRNAAATELLGGVASDTGQVREAGYYGLTTLDGDPLAPETMAHARAMRGEHVAGERIRVCNDGLPQGRVLEVTAAPLPLHQRTDGEPETTSATTAATDGPGAKTSGAVVVYHDATASQDRENEMAQFAAVVAHDLRGPLGGLRGWLELATDTVAEDCEDTTPPETVTGVGASQQHALLALLGRAERSAAQLDQLITDLLDHAVMRRATLRTEPLDLATVVRQVLDSHEGPAGDQKSLQATTDIPAHLPSALADPVLLHQMLTNLVGNAVKYVRPGERPHVVVSAFAHDGLLHVTVADRGIGVPAGQHQRIFNDLHRAHTGYTGSGLGLGLCRRIIQRHGGTIAAADNPGGGTRITFTLPTVPTQRQNSPAAPLPTRSR